MLTISGIVQKLGKKKFRVSENSFSTNSFLSFGLLNFNHHDSIVICFLVSKHDLRHLFVRLLSSLQGRTYEPGGIKDEMADAIREFNKTIVKDPRVDVVALPFRDGVSIVMRK